MIGVVLIAMLSCSKNNNTSADDKKADNNPIDLRIAVMPGMDCMPFYVAESYGMFEKEGLVVRLVPFRAHMDIDTALVGGSVDMAVTDKYRVEYLKKQGASLSIWAPAQTEWTLVANKKSRLTNTGQFGGKVVAMTRNSATDHLSETAFSELTERPPYFVQINDVIVRKNMMVGGELDAAWLQEPQVSEILSHGHNIVNTNVEKEQMGQFVYRNKGKYTKTKGDKLRKIYNNACDSINKNGIKAYPQQLVNCCFADTAALKKMGSFRFKKI